MSTTEQPAASSDPVLPGIGAPDLSLERSLRTALAERGPGYRPRTRHLRADGSPTYVNRLIREASPYLLQHAHNPVNFFPWGEEALARAVALDRPILLSIGYSTCHWCHVMERESFEDEEIAAYLNEHYVSIKVDREERPDLDDIYMLAVQMLTGRGGWPMTVVLTPDLKPFFGGTYFPPRDGVRGAHRGFLSILKVLAERFQEDRAQISAHAERLSQEMRRAAEPQPAGAVPGFSALAQGARALANRFDARDGGFGRPPKFPQPARLSLLLRYFRRTRDADALRMVVRTLRAMAAGGMYDHVGGGFHRYSTDGHWLVPHFEKMLYDNAQLATVYLEGYQATGDGELRRVAEETLQYVAREMTAPSGGFFSATDADSELPGGDHNEGYFFTWTPAEIDELLTTEGAAFVKGVYGVTERGNFEGRNILSTARPREALAAELGLSPRAFVERLDGYREMLYRARAQRPAPARDDKLLTAWNGLMIGAFARGAFVLGRSDHLETARRAADFVLAHMRDERGRLRRSYLAGRAAHAAVLEDYTFLVAGLLDLFEASWEVRYLEAAVELQALQDDHFQDPAGGYFATSDDHERLLFRDKPSYDGAVPSGNSVAAMNLLRLAEVTMDMTYRSRAEGTLSAFAGELEGGGLSVPAMLSALDRYLDVPLEVVIARAEGTDAEPLLEVVRGAYLPNRMLFVRGPNDPAGIEERVPLLAHKAPIGGRTTAYVCERGRCELPTSDPAVLARQLRRARVPDPAPPALGLSRARE